MHCCPYEHHSTCALGRFVIAFGFHCLLATHVFRARTLRVSETGESKCCQIQFNMLYLLTQASRETINATDRTGECAFTHPPPAMSL